MSTDNLNKAMRDYNASLPTAEQFAEAMSKLPKCADLKPGTQRPIERLFGAFARVGEFVLSTTAEDFFYASLMFFLMLGFCVSTTAAFVFLARALQ